MRMQSLDDRKRSRDPWEEREVCELKERERGWICRRVQSEFFHMGLVGKRERFTLFQMGLISSIVEIASI